MINNKSIFDLISTLNLKPRKVQRSGEWLDETIFVNAEKENTKDWENILAGKITRKKDLSNKVTDCWMNGGILWKPDLVNELELIDLDKKIDFCFIGTLFPLHVRSKWRNRWFFEWVYENFTEDSYFDACIAKEDLNRWNTLGKYDFTKSPKKYRHKSKFKNFDHQYFLPMKESKFVLAPAGDLPWSYRFYEAITCRAIPIVQSPQHSWINEYYRKIPFNFYTLEDEFIYREDWAKENLELFIKHCVVS
jgi:hypothetical protein